MTNTPKILTVGSGTLTLSSNYTDLARQATKCVITPKHQSKPGVTTLSGGQTPTRVDTSWTMEVEFFQDLGQEGSVTEWTKTHHGETVDFTYTPANTSSKQVTGKVVVTATEIGGTVGENATASASWDIPGDITIA